MAGLVGTLVQQLDSSALRDPALYASEMATFHQRYDPLTILGVNVGPTLVDVFEKLGFFHIFNVWWFVSLLSLLVVSIVVCTIDRLPRLWRSVRDVRLVQPAAFYDLRLPHRADFTGGGPDEAAVWRVLRRHRFVVRRSQTQEGPDGAGVVTLYGDRNQYCKLATLITHLGLILFLVGGTVTVTFGFQTVLLLGVGQSSPVQPVGTPNDLIIKNLAFQAPERPNGTVIDYRTNVAVYQNGREIARQTIHVNTPMTVDGFVIHQSSYGPAPDLVIHAANGQLVWSGPVVLSGQLAGLPQGLMTIPGSDLDLMVALDKSASGAPLLDLQGIAPADPATGSSGALAPPSGTPGGAQSGAAGSAAVTATRTAFLQGLALGATTDPAQTGGYAIQWRSTSAFSGILVRKDPGQEIVWFAFGCLITGLALTFYFPRRRVWARIDGAHVQLAMLADRYVDVEREFRQLLLDLERSAPAG